MTRVLTIVAVWFAIGLAYSQVSIPAYEIANTLDFTVSNCANHFQSPEPEWVCLTAIGDIEAAPLIVNYFVSANGGFRWVTPWIEPDGNAITERQFSYGNQTYVMTFYLANEYTVLMLFR